MEIRRREENKRAGQKRGKKRGEKTGEKREKEVLEAGEEGKMERGDGRRGGW